VLPSLVPLVHSAGDWDLGLVEAPLSTFLAQDLQDRGGSMPAVCSIINAWNCCLSLLQECASSEVSVPGNPKKFTLHLHVAMAVGELHHSILTAVSSSGVRLQHALFGQALAQVSEYSHHAKSGTLSKNFFCLEYTTGWSSPNLLSSPTFQLLLNLTGLQVSSACRKSFGNRIP
jgi:hypothetical protein